MICNDYQSDILKSLKPQYIRMYLNSRGWHRDSSSPTFDVFRNEDLDEAVIVPNSSSYIDYKYKVEDLVRIVSEAEGLPQSIVVNGMMLSSATDIFEYRYCPHNGEIGLIPIPEMMEILETGKNLTNYAYRDLKAFNKSYYSQRWEGQKLVDELRIGPTIPGSYIVQFIYPSIDINVGVQTTLSEEPILTKEDVRLVCNKIEKSMNIVVDAAERGEDSLEPVDTISYNFVSSMMGLNFNDAEVEVKRLMIIEKDKESVPRPVQLTNKIFNRISVIEKNMRPPEMNEDRKFSGRLTEIKDNRYSNDLSPGILRIRYFENEKKIGTAKLCLSDDDLHNAYDAMRDQKTVSVKGKLVGCGNSKRIEDPYDFKVLDD